MNPKYAIAQESISMQFQNWDETKIACKDRKALPFRDALNKKVEQRLCLLQFQADKLVRSFVLRIMLGKGRLLGLSIGPENFIGPDKVYAFKVFFT